MPWMVVQGLHSHSQGVHMQSMHAGMQGDAPYPIAASPDWAAANPQRSAQTATDMLNFVIVCCCCCVVGWWVVVGDLRRSSSSAGQDDRSATRTIRSVMSCREQWHAMSAAALEAGTRRPTHGPELACAQSNFAREMKKENREQRNASMGNFALHG